VRLGERGVPDAVPVLCWAVGSRLRPGIGRGSGIRFKIIAPGSSARRRNVRAMTQQAPHQHSYTIPLEWESRVPIVTTVRTIEMTRSHSTDKPSSWVTSATRVTVVGCECGATYRRDLPL
jgi:hypothetical protein